MAELLAAQLSVAALLVVSVFMQYFGKKTAGPSLPPGPKPLPIIGNVRDLPRQGVPEFQHWMKHNQQYGSISSITVMGKTLVILHDKDAVRYLLEKKALHTSSRPQLEFGHKLCGYRNLLPLQQYDDEYRRRRKIVHQQLGTRTAVVTYEKIQEVEARRLLHRVLGGPEDLIQHIKTFSASIMLKMTYGYSVEPSKVDPLVTLIERVLDNLTAAFLPMTWAVDVIPALKHLPTWFPGTAFKKTARDWNKLNQDSADIPYFFVQRQMRTFSHRPSYVSRVLEQSTDCSTGEAKLRDINDNVVKWTAATLYGAGSETTSSILTSFILAMVNFPEVQRKAQEEIDSLTRRTRLPTFEDRHKLPYVNNIVTESYRWFPIIPMGVVHMSDEDIIYNGYLIPKGSYLLPAVWWFCQDPDVYTDPSSFNPDRYKEPRMEPDPRSVVFGFGRRVCPGRYLADSSLFISIVQTLAAFTIAKAIDENGREIEARVEPTPSLTNHPKEFPFRIVPRSTKHTCYKRYGVYAGLSEADQGLTHQHLEKIKRSRDLP